MDAHDRDPVENGFIILSITCHCVIPDSILSLNRNGSLHLAARFLSGIERAELSGTEWNGLNG